MWPSVVIHNICGLPSLSIITCIPCLLLSSLFCRWNHRWWNSSEWQWSYQHILQTGALCCQVEGHWQGFGIQRRRDGCDWECSLIANASSKELSQRNADSMVTVGSWRWAWQYRFCYKGVTPCCTLKGQLGSASWTVSVRITTFSCITSILFLLYHSFVEKRPQRLSDAHAHNRWTLNLLYICIVRSRLEMMMS